MANIRVTCPACKSVLEVDKKHEGEEIECGNCLENFKAERPKGGGEGPHIVMMVVPGAVPRKRDERPPRKRRRRRDDDDDDDDEYAPPPERRGRDSSGPGDGAATASLILGVIALVLVCCWPLSVTLSIIAIGLGSAGMKSRSNKALAVTGLTLGLIVLCGVGVIFFAGAAGAFGPILFR